MSEFEQVPEAADSGNGTPVPVPVPVPAPGPVSEAATGPANGTAGATDAAAEPETPVAAAMRELETLGERDLGEHPDVYQRIHAELQAALATIDNA